MMFHSIEALAAVARVERLFVVLAPLDRHWGEHDWSALPDKIEALFCGGARRSESVLNALKFLEPRIAKDHSVIVHHPPPPPIPTHLVYQFPHQIAHDPLRCPLP